MTAEILHLPSPKEQGKQLTYEQQLYWQHQLEISQRAAEYAMRMLGISKPEKGLHEDEKDNHSL